MAEFDGLHRGDVVLADDAFKQEGERPWLVSTTRNILSTESSTLLWRSRRGRGTTNEFLSMRVTS